MTEVELLREAANTMRERAQAASEGPWKTGGDDGLVWPPRIGDPVSGSSDLDDAEHIASWHPAVALAVADWLDLEARMAELRDNSPEGHTFHALDVARAYLGRVS